MSKKGRQTGFYWVKFEGAWIVAYYFNFSKHWQLCGNDEKMFDREFTEINETRLTPPAN